MRGIIGRVRGGVSILRTRCFARSRVCFRRVTLCGISVPRFRSRPRTSGIVHHCGTQVIRIGPMFTVIRGGKVDRRVASLCRRLDTLGYILRFIHSKHITVAADYFRHIGRFLTSHRAGCGLDGGRRGWVDSSGGVKDCGFVTRPFRMSFGKHLAVKILNGRLLGYTNFRTDRHNFKVTALGRSGCA